MMENKDQKSMIKTLQRRKWTGIGLAFGILIGFFNDNVGMWLAIGMICGVTMDNHEAKKAKNE
jgi:hypothetical protein